MAGDIPKVSLIWGSDTFVRLILESIIETLPIKLNIIDASLLEEKKLVSILFYESLFEKSELNVLKYSEKNDCIIKYINEIHTTPINKKIIFTFTGKPNKSFNTVIQNIKNLNVFLLNCSTPSKSDCLDLICDNVKRLGCSLDKAAVKFIYERIDKNLDQITNSVRTACLASTNKTCLSIEQLSCFDAINNEIAFKLSDHLLQKDHTKAQILLCKLLDDGNSPLALLGIISRHLRICLMLNKQTKKSTPTDQIAKDLKLPVFVIDKYRKYLKQANINNITSALTICFETDILLKTSSLSPETALSKIFTEL